MSDATVTRRRLGSATPSTGCLHDVLLCPPDNFRWLPTSAISKATLASGAPSTPRPRPRSTPSWSPPTRRPACDATSSRPTPRLPYQVFARDSSVATPGGADRHPARAALAPRRVRAGHPLLRGQRDPDPRDDHRGLDRGRRRDHRRARLHPDRQRRGAHPDPGRAPARRLARGRRLGGADRADPGQFVHIDVLVSILAPKLAAVCVEAASGGLVAWLREQGFEILEVSVEDAFGLGVNAISLGDDRVISTKRSARLNEQLRALGLDVLDPDLSMFTLGGGGAHCLAQALRREPGLRRRRRSTPPRVIADLRELARPHRRRGRGPAALLGRGWREARAFLRRALAELGVEPEIDEAGNLWARLPGTDRDAPALALGSHLDSVPDGGWLDGALGVIAALGVLRSYVDAGERPPATSSSSTGPTRRAPASAAACSAARPSRATLDLDDGPRADATPTATRCRRCWPRTASTSTGSRGRRAPRAPRRLPRAAHRAGPAARGRGLALAAVDGCVGVERHASSSRGQAAHAGTTPMDMRRDAGLAAARPRWRSSAIPARTVASRRPAAAPRAGI